MKKIISLLLVMSLLLCGCGDAGSEPTDPSTDPSTQESTGEIIQDNTEDTTEEVTEEPTEPEPTYENPITGETCSQEITTRFVTVSIGNTADAMPHHGLSQADMVFEMYVNGLTTRLFALYTDPTDVFSIGSVRSHRYPFTDLAIGYDAFSICSGGSSPVLTDANRSIVDYTIIHTEDANYYCFRDQERLDADYAWEHCLFLIGESVYKLAEDLGIRTTRDMEKDYGMTFAQGQALTEGETANTVTVTFHLSSNYKDSIMTYNADTGLYEFAEYGTDVVDGNNGKQVAFRNVFVLFAPTHTDESGYHIPDILGSGEGYFACDGYMIPIQWHRENETDTFTFTLEDGTPLAQGVGASYVAIVPTQSSVSCE